MADDIWIAGGLLTAVGAIGFLTYKNAMDKKQLVAALSKAAKPVADETGIPLAFIVAQAAHESNYGQSGLAVRSKNLFGIKAGGNWVGEFDTWPTYEVVAGQEIKVNAKFRKYSTWESSVRDWARLIQSRYPKAFAAALKGNSTLFFSELQRGGYATDPQYAAKLVGVLKSLEAIV